MARPARSRLLALLACALGGCGADGAALDDLRPGLAPTRIVAGSVLAAEVLLAIAPRERIAAVHYVAADPIYSLVAAEVRDLPQVGAEPEHLISVDPDLVIVDAFTAPETLALLSSAQVPVLRTTPAISFDQIAANILRIGRACQLDEAAGALVAAMRRRLGGLADRGRSPRPWRLMSLAGGMHTHGRGSLFDAVVTAAGARNLAAENGAGPFRIVTAESVLAWRPEALVIMTDDEVEERKWIANKAGFSLLPAVADDHLVFVPKALFGTTSHRIVDLVAFVQDSLHAWGDR